MTRTARRGRTPSRSAMASARVASPSDSRLIVTPAVSAADSSASRLPGPAKLTGRPSRSTFANSPAEATSKPSTSSAIAASSGGNGLALIA
ncbi:hypothetical protein QE385_001210 [Sphingomonas sp. SORGH_AS 950]|nr:hypothetical protein [Sphingomonas sp. SORGH_AS_0950]